MVDFTIKVPASSANIGCGYDTLGLALALWLELRVTYLDVNGVQSAPSNTDCDVSVEGLGAEKISTSLKGNLILSTAINVLLCHDVRGFPRPLHVHIINRIPLGRGLGSSGAAIVAGVMLANVVGGLSMSKDRMMEFCLVEESHPDNIGPSLFGGFRGSFTASLASAKGAILEDSPNETGQVAEGSSNTFSHARYPSLRAISVNYRWSEEIKVIAVIPDYEVKTEHARAALPASYEKASVVSNLQRVAVLPLLLGSSPLQREDIHAAMKDELHQQQRRHLVHGLESALELGPIDLPGLLGVCLSGAGPTVLALATENFDAIAERLISVIQSSTEQEFHCEWQLLEPALDGAVVLGAAEHNLAVTESDGCSTSHQHKKRKSMHDQSATQKLESNGHT